MKRAVLLRGKECRHALRPSRVRIEVLAEKLEKQWCELRRHATMENDPAKLLWLRGEFDKRKRRAESLDDCDGH